MIVVNSDHYYTVFYDKQHITTQMFYFSEIQILVRLISIIHRYI